MPDSPKEKVILPGNLPPEVVTIAANFLGLRDLGMFAKVNSHCNKVANTIKNDRLKNVSIQLYGEAGPKVRTRQQQENDLIAYKHYQKFNTLFKKYREKDTVTTKEINACVEQLKKAIMLGDLTAIFDFFENTKPVVRGTPIIALERRHYLKRFYYNKLQEKLGKTTSLNSFCIQKALNNGWPPIIFHFFSNFTFTEKNPSVTQRLLGATNNTSSNKLRNHTIGRIFQGLIVMERACKEEVQKADRQRRITQYKENFINQYTRLVYLLNILKGTSEAVKKLSVQFNICYAIAKKTYAFDETFFHITLHEQETETLKNKSFAEKIELLHQAYSTLVNTHFTDDNEMQETFKQAEEVGEEYAKRYIENLNNSQEKQPQQQASTSSEYTTQPVGETLNNAGMTAWNALRKGFGF